MNRIQRCFAHLRRRKQKALIAYVTAGFPSLKTLPSVVGALADQRVDLVEIGIPFSDPLADGPTIQASSASALRHGMKVKKLFPLVRKIRRSFPDLPMLFMTYYNPVFHFGLKAFCRQASGSGIDGLIVPDLPPEEAGDLLRASRAAGLDLVFLAAPTSPRGRLKRIAHLSKGFIYCVSLTGVTGARNSVNAQLTHVRQLKRITKLPVCVGFGISNSAQARKYLRSADGIIIGSALISAIGRAAGSPAKAAADFIRPIERVCHAQ